MKKTDTSDPIHDKEYIARDISWLHFNYRVLQEAKNPEVPLYERIKFLAIYLSNLDEFFRVRVASLRSFKKLRKKVQKEMEISPKKELKEIRRMVRKQQTEFGMTFRKEILPGLSRQGIHLIKGFQYNFDQQEFAMKFFSEKIMENLRPVHMDEEGDGGLFLENKALYFVVTWKDRPTQLTWVNIPTDSFGRFIRLPGKDGKFYITFLDDLIRFNLPGYFDDRPIEGIYSVKLSRDAEIYIEDEFSGDLVEKIKAGLEERHLGLPTRFLYDTEMPKEVLKRIRTKLELKKDDIIPGARYHNFSDFFAFPNPTQNLKLQDPPYPPLPHPELRSASSILKAIDEKDRILHFPYQSVDYLLQFMQEAVEDEDVKEIKITLYRVASGSLVGNKLLEAIQRGKKVTVFIEAKARFDEASNLNWGRRLSEAGAKVRYSYPGIKVHTKLLLINKRIEGKIRRYVYIGTGNFNEKTAKLYCDHALLSADERLSGEVSRIFDLLENQDQAEYKHLLVAPTNLQKAFMRLVDLEIENARQGKVAYMILKMNSLENKEMIDKLYEAGQAGVKIDLIVRGICCLVPGVPGLSENIRAISLVDRFLEHARVYIFCNGGKEKMFIASADWMTRNLKQRIEVAAPIYDRQVFDEIRKIIDIQLADNCKARLLAPGRMNRFVNNGKVM